MGTPPLSEDAAREARDAVLQHGSQNKAAEALQMARSTLQDRIRRGRELHPHLFQTGDTAGFPAGDVRHYWQVVSDGEGNRVSAFVKVAEQDRLAERIAEVLAAIRDPLPPSKILAEPEEDYLNMLTLPDWHLLMQAWGRETGESYDVDIAKAEMMTATDRLLARARPAGTAVVLGVGDQFHVRDDTSRVGRGRHDGQVDGRINKGFHIALWSFVHVIRRALETHQMVKVRILPGNHDEHMAGILAEALAAFFHLEPRVAVDLDPSYWWGLAFGKCFFAGTHGDNIRNRRDAAGIASWRYRAQLANANSAYLFTGHLHNEKVADTPGWLHVQLRAMTAADAHAAMSFLTPREVSLWTFHKARGRQDVLHEPLPLEAV